MRNIIFIFLLCPFVLKAVISPTSQAQADNWLYIKVNSVKLEKHSKHTHVIVEAQIVKMFFSKNNKFQANDIVNIFYKINNPELNNRPPKVIGGYVPPRVLKEEECTYAFLNDPVAENPQKTVYVTPDVTKEEWEKTNLEEKEDEEINKNPTEQFTPAAAPWSFSPPQGIPEEQRKALGMVVCSKQVNGCKCLSKEVISFHGNEDDLSK